MDVRRRSTTARPIELVRTDLDEGSGIAVVGGIDHDDVLLPRVRAGKSQGQFIRLAARTHKETHAQWLWQGSAEALGVTHEVLVQVARVGVEHRHLLLSRFDHAWMAVTNVTDIVDRIEVGATILVVEVLHPTPDKLEWLLVGDAE